MGNFYTNIVLVGPEATAVRDYLASERRAAYVHAASSSMTVVYDQKCDTQNIDEIHSLGATLTEKFRCSAVSCLNHDDDFLYLSAYENGQLLSEYDSSAMRQLNPIRLCSAAGVSAVRSPFVLLLLLTPKPLFAVFKHMLLVKALGLPRASVAAGYDYIARGEPPIGVSNQPVPVIHTLDPGNAPPSC